MHRSSLALALTGILAACAPAEEAPAEAPMAEERSTAEDVAAIDALTEREGAAFAGGDLAGLKTIFADQCLVIQPEGPPVECGGGFDEWFEGLQEQFEVTAEYTDLNTEVVGDLAVQHFSAILALTPRAGGEMMSTTNNGIHVFRRQTDGSWRIIYDVWTPNAPNGM